MLVLYVVFLSTFSSKYSVISSILCVSSINYLEVWFLVSHCIFYRLLKLTFNFVALLSKNTISVISILLYEMKLPL